MLNIHNAQKNSPPPVKSYLAQNVNSVEVEKLLPMTLLREVTGEYRNKIGFKNMPLSLTKGLELGAVEGEVRRPKSIMSSNQFNAEF